MSIGYQRSFPIVKRPGREVNHLGPSSVEVMYLQDVGRTTVQARESRILSWALYIKLTFCSYLHFVCSVLIYMCSLIRLFRTMLTVKRVSLNLIFVICLLVYLKSGSRVVYMHIAASYFLQILRQSVKDNGCQAFVPWSMQNRFIPVDWKQAAAV
jgi:hypothetical protein